MVLLGHSARASRSFNVVILGLVAGGLLPAFAPAGQAGADELPILSVRSFGATGDDASDDTAAIQRALDAVPDAGAKVKFPPGRYLVSTPLVPRDRTRMSGHVAEDTILQGTDIFQHILDVADRDQLGISKLTLTYESSAWDTPLAAHAIHSFIDVDGLSSTDVSITECIIRDTPKQGLVSQGTTRENGPRRWRLVNSRFERTGRGSAIFWNGTDILVESNTFQTTGDDAIGFVADTRNSIAQKNSIFGAGTNFAQGAGVKLHGSFNLVRNNYIEGSVTAGVFLKRSNLPQYPPPADNIIVNNDIVGIADTTSSATQAGIQITAVVGTTTVAGNRVRAQSATRNYDVVRIEGSTQADVVISQNELVGNLGGAPGRAGVNLTNSVRNLDIVDNRFDTLGDTVRIDSKALDGFVNVIANRFVGQHANSVVRMGPVAAGFEALRVLDNVSQGHTGPFLSLVDRPLQLLRIGGNDIGTASMLATGTARVVSTDDGPPARRTGFLKVPGGVETAAVDFGLTPEPDADYVVVGSAVLKTEDPPPAWVVVTPGARTAQGFNLRVLRSGAPGAVAAVAWQSIR